MVKMSINFQSSVPWCVPAIIRIYANEQGIADNTVSHFYLHNLYKEVILIQKSWLCAMKQMDVITWFPQILNINDLITGGHTWDRILTFAGNSHIWKLYDCLWPPLGELGNINFVLRGLEKIMETNYAPCGIVMLDCSPARTKFHPHLAGVWVWISWTGETPNVSIWLSVKNTKVNNLSEYRYWLIHWL